MHSCPSCGHDNQDDTFCESCGAALGGASFEEDSALSLMLGLVCSACDTYNDPGTATCIACAAPLVDDDSFAEATVPHELAPSAPAVMPPTAQPIAPPAPAPSSAQAPPAWMSAPVGSPLATAAAMKAVDLASLKSGEAVLAEPSTTPRPAPEHLEEQRGSANAPCHNCGSELLPGDIFCRHCGTRAGPQASAAAPSAAAPSAAALAPTTVGATLMFSAATVERFARLILIKGDSSQGNQWRLREDGPTVIGRAGEIAFPADPFLKPQHCWLEFRGQDLFVVPDDQTNGVFLRMTADIELQLGDQFVVGTQRFQIMGPKSRKALHAPSDGQGTLLAAGAIGEKETLLLKRLGLAPDLDETYARSQRLLSIGRGGCDLNFPGDPYMSTRHAQLSHDGTRYTLHDLDSRNGTYVRAQKATQLHHGQAIMIGDQVLRVEVGASIARG